MNLNSYVSQIIAFAEKLPNSVKVGVAGLFALTLFYTGSSFFTTNDVVANAVKITNKAQNSGGSGVILTSHTTHSDILTNAHVCGVVANGGYVITNTGQYMVDSFRVSKQHDLCVVTVKNNLHAFTKVASRAPKTYYEPAFVAGHPALFPTVVSTGRFSGKQVIEVLTGFTPCTAENTNSGNIMYCMFLGGIPIVKSYESTLVSATIMAGSSGSGIFNSDMDLTGLVFAGQQGLSYAWSVPFEYVSNFLNYEVRTLERKQPNFFRDFSNSGQERKEVDYFENLRNACDKTKVNKAINNLCIYVKDDLIWRKGVK